MSITPSLPRMPREAFDREFPLLSENDPRKKADEKTREIFLELLKLEHLKLLSKSKFPDTPLYSVGMSWLKPIEKKPNENSRITIRPESKEEGFNDLKYFIENLEHYIKNGYPVILPQNDKLKILCDNPKLLLIFEEFYKSLFNKEIYDVSFYLKDLKEIFLAQSILEEAAKKLQILNKNWGFKIFKKYEIVLSLSGADVRYKAEKDQIIYLVLPKDIKRAKPCFEIIIHEMVHVGVDNMIVREYNLNYYEKERLVDLICMIYLKALLPHYSEQPIEDKSIDEYITEDTILNNLPLAIAKFVEKHPRD
ncbi:MAG: hypothetical protein K940chlam5_00868 [Candidatus Anoxychlamydiales bacterium]|nr:hypothetical protein [Candidatus Anoxychlamydiales bacterium]